MKNELTFRLATVDNLYDIVCMLADDTLGASREKADLPLLPEYIKAFEIISADPKQELTIVEMDGETVGTFQLTFVQNIAHQGGLRAQVESVRTHAAHRGKGIGKKVFEYIINRAKEKGCVLLQLTSDKQRPDAIRFYEKLGFVTSHEGMKIKFK
ncbi:MAG: GNAT family N-acetyltransferase [Chitinophagaceae bacterium]